MQNITEGKHNGLYDSTFANKWIVMSVLRMIKLFGWESRVKGTVAEKRETELGWIWKQKMLDLVNSSVK